MGRKASARTPGYLLSALHSFRANLADAERHPPRLESPYQTRLDLGMNDYAFSRLFDSSSRTNHQALVPGAKEIWITRRIDWAIAEILRRGSPINESNIAKTARIRLETLRRYFEKSSVEYTKRPTRNHRT